MENKLSGIRSRTYEIELYPDDKSHMEALEKLKSQYNIAYILHDSDIWSNEDELKNPSHKAGTLKKPHYHVIVKFGNARYLNPLSQDLGIPSRYIIKRSDIKIALRYLIHKDDTDKYQYLPEDVHGNLLDEFMSAISDISEGDTFIFMMDILDNIICPCSITELARTFALRGYFGQFRRSFALWNMILKEHNERLGAVEDMWNE